jgi:DNA polymerase-3 subunit alpha
MYTLIETYQSDDKDLATIAERSFPSCCLIEDPTGLRWFISPRVDEVSAHVWAKAHAAGAVGLIHKSGSLLMSAETFMNQRIDNGTAYEVPPGLWAESDSAPSYSLLMEIESREPEVSEGTFVHLHTHGEHSALDGLSTIPELVTVAAYDGNTALALTDHGTCAGHPMLQRECDKAGIKPIFGMEAYFIDERTERPESGDTEAQARLRQYKHLILLAKNNVGLRNLWALSTEGNRDGFYYKPRIDWDSLERHHEGIIATTACLGGPVSQLVLDGKEDEARQILGRLTDIFGEDLYVEIQPSELPEQIRLNVLLVELAHKLNLPIVAAADGHYPRAADKELHKTWLACQTSSDNENYWHFDHSMPESEMRQRLSYLPQDVVDDAIHNTVVIASQCDARIEAPPKTPIFSRKGGHQADVERLLKICTENWGKIKGTAYPQEVYVTRFEQEMKLLIDKQFCGYFLIVWDYVDWAKRQGILVGPGRGSGGGSLVAYLANITEVDPVQNELMFERFLTKGRTSLPDFDLDFPASKRAVLQDYLRERWGDDHVMRVGTHLRYKNRGIIQKLFSALADELPGTAFADAKAISKLIDAAEAGTAGLGLSWDELWAQQGDALAPYKDKYPRLFEIAERLVGRLNSYGKHAAGMVVSTDERLDDRWPMRAGGDGEAMISQFEFPDLELLWLIKLDLLTLRTLDTIQETIDLIEELRGYRINVYDWHEEYEDPQVWEEISEGHTLGIFQIETASGTKLAKQMRPDSLQSLADMGSVVRPGPMRSGLTDVYLRRRNGQEAVTFPDPRMEEFLGKTYGCMIYQEDILTACMELAGYSGDEADGVRKILGKKKVEAVQVAGEKFTARCIENGMTREAVDRLWAQMAEFAKYGFGRAHAFAYAVVSYWTAWLKVHYPVEFLTAALSTVDKDRAFDFVAEARRLGVTVLPPDINESGVGFRPGVLTIRYGLDAIKGVGSKAVADLTVGQPYNSFADFIERKGKNANSGVVLTLARVGAFDSLEPNRRALVERLEATKSGESAKCVFKTEDKVLLSAFIGVGPRTDEAMANGLPCQFAWDREEPPINPKNGKKLKLKPVPKRCTKACRNYTAPEPIDPATVPNYSDEEIRQIEAEMLGGHLSSTPFDALPDDLREELYEQAQAALSGPEGLYNVCGVLTKVRKHTDRNGRDMGFLMITTEAAELDVVVFGDHWELYQSSLALGSLVLAEIRKTYRQDRDGFSLVNFINVQ